MPAGHLQRCDQAEPVPGAPAALLLECSAVGSHPLRKVLQRCVRPQGDVTVEQITIWQTTILWLAARTNKCICIVYTCVLNVEMFLLHKETQAVQFETEVRHGLHLWTSASDCAGDSLELSEETACKEQTRGVLQESLSDIPGVWWESAEERALWLSQRNRPQLRECEFHLTVLHVANCCFYCCRGLQWFLWSGSMTE